ncbi:TetR/AcrR family transcriptional regulator [Gordonia desulfuricans]|uniref:TetR/AcrR family transcriptional regulator n=1 Tax=Gordonia desulfuricans TaxID=89051 RepID=A0A7K3LJP4_9ACTN|nr:TetR/AcrR family transcriptional regulator [Gordonia desulfuricans]NDK88444.1 TetR/AcrR family transcriptional regulator [Gordonia desulfuricans]
MGPAQTATDTETDTAVSVTDRLLDATEKLLAEHGIRATTMQQVAEVAGVSRAWLYRHFPDKRAMVGAAIVRLTASFWTDARAELSTIDGFAGRLTAGVRIGRGAYDDPGTLLLRLRTDEPDEYAACVDVGVAALIPDLAAFWRPFVDEAITGGELHSGHDPAEVAEWVARVLISLGTMPSATVDADDPVSVRRQIDRYVMPALRSAP